MKKKHSKDARDTSITNSTSSMDQLLNQTYTGTTSGNIGTTNIGTTTASPYWQQNLPAYPSPPLFPSVDKKVDELAETLGVDPIQDMTHPLIVTGEKGTYSVIELLAAMLKRLDGRIDCLKQCPECGGVGEVDPGDYLCRGCRNVA